MTAAVGVQSLAGRSPWLPDQWIVRGTRRELDDTVTLELDAIDDPPPTRAQPGQFNMLWAFGVGEVPISVSGIAEGGRRLQHTIRAVGAVSEKLCELEPGDVVGIRGPFGTTWSIDGLASSADPLDLVIVAGGLGLAPLRPVVLEAMRQRDRFGRVLLLQGARSPDQLLFTDDLGRWSADGIDVRLIVDHADERWRGPVGVVTKLVKGAIVDPARTFAMVCGPEMMMRLVGSALVDAGIPPGQIEVSLERNMACGMGLCGHCQLGSVLLCRDGPVVPWSLVEPLVRVPEL